MYCSITAGHLPAITGAPPAPQIRLLAACTYKFTPPVPAAGLAGGPAPLAWQSRAVSTPSLQDRGLKAWWSRFSARWGTRAGLLHQTLCTGPDSALTGLRLPVPEKCSVQNCGVTKTTGQFIESTSNCSTHP